MAFFENKEMLPKQLYFEIHFSLNEQKVNATVWVFSDNLNYSNNLTKPWKMQYKVFQTFLIMILANSTVLGEEQIGLVIFRTWVIEKVQKAGGGLWDTQCGNIQCFRWATSNTYAKLFEPTQQRTTIMPSAFSTIVTQSIFVLPKNKKMFLLAGRIITIIKIFRPTFVIILLKKPFFQEK